MNDKMTRQEMDDMILNMYNDSAYQELKAYYDKTTVFNVLGIERSETHHSSFLCWLLNANSSHGLGEEPIKKLLRLYASKMETNDSFRIMLMTGNYEVDMTDIGTEITTAYVEDSQRIPTKKKDRMDIWATMTLKDHTGNEQSVALVIENKIYSSEGKNQTERYHRYVTNVCGNDMIPVEIYLAPQMPKSLSCKEFVYINYQELLDSVIMPLTHQDMPAEASQIVSDYIRNLSKPSTAIDGKSYTILAISATERNKLLEFYNRHRQLFNTALVAGNMQKVGRNKECQKLIEGIEQIDLLAELWHSNEELFKIVLFVLKENPDSPIMEFSPIVYDSVFKETNRDSTKYNVIFDGTVIGWHLSQAQTALHVFKAYLMQYKDATLDDLRHAFPRDLNNYTYFQYFDYLFYDAGPDNPAWDRGALKGQYGHGDFYTKEKDLLTVKDNNAEKKVMCVKWWKKTDGSFQKLMDLVEEKYPFIQTEEY
jgi:hypothetical protein